MNKFFKGVYSENKKKTMKKRMIYLVLFSIVTVLTMCLISMFAINSGKDAEIELIEETDVIIVLGAGLWGDRVSPQLSLRLHTAYGLMLRNDKLIAVVSGGQGPDELISEAQAMSDYLVNMGIDSSRIIMEDQSTSTTENLKFTKKILEKKGLETSAIGIVTTDFHVFRAEMLARRIGLEVQGHAAPNIESIKLKNNIREIAALIKDFVFTH